MRHLPAVFDEIYLKEKWGKGKGSGLGSQPKIAKPYLDYLYRSIPNGAHVLDVGCGDMQLYAGFDLNRWQYTGCDVSKAVLDTARATRDVTMVHLERGDASEVLSLCAGVDVVLFKDVMMHWTDEELILFLDEFCAGYEGLIIASHNHKFVRNPKDCNNRVLNKSDSWCPIGLNHPAMIEHKFVPVKFFSTHDIRVILERKAK